MAEPLSFIPQTESPSPPNTPVHANRLAGGDRQLSSVASMWLDWYPPPQDLLGNPPPPFVYAQVDLQTCMELGPQLVNHPHVANKLKAGFIPLRGNWDLQTGWLKTKRDRHSQTIKWSCHDADRLRGKECVLSGPHGHYVWQAHVLNFLGQSNFKSSITLSDHVFQFCIWKTWPPNL